MTPTLQFTIGGDNSIVTPYYYPINVSSDLTIKPKFDIDDDFSSLNFSKLDTNYEQINPSGQFLFNLTNQRNKQNNELT